MEETPKKQNIDTKKRSPAGAQRPSGPYARSRRTYPERTREESEWESKVIDLRRVTRVVAGGKRFKFRACVIVGNQSGSVGVGVAKGEDVAQAVNKASRQARRSAITVPLKNFTIPHEVKAKYGPSQIMLKPAPAGAGIIAGGAVRIVASLAGIKNISGKMLSRTTNHINNARATLKALGKLKSFPVSEKPKVAPDAAAASETK